jgi:hypothetical protein
MKRMAPHGSGGTILPLGDPSNWNFVCNSLTATRGDRALAGCSGPGSQD